LSAEYNRPLDRIESGLLIAVALWQSNEKDKAIRQLEQAVSIAMPYNFTQLFINEGNDLLPLLLELRKKASKSTGLANFMDRLTQDIYKTLSKSINRKYKPKPANEEKTGLTERQRAMLLYLSKGMTYREIADAIGITRATVKHHVLSLYGRLGVNNAREAILKAKMFGLPD